MTQLSILEAGGYSYIPGVFQYSAGVAALPGYAIERVRFAEPVPLADGFARIERHIAEAGRPAAAFCACELRSPAPFTEAGFRAFNEVYVGTLKRWGVFRDEADNAVARANVCPQMDPPAEPSFHAFCYTVARAVQQPSFVVAGSGEVAEGKGSYRDHIVAAGDTSPTGLAAKARFVLGEMERRLTALGAGWGETTAVQLYTVHDVHPLLETEIARRGAMRHGLTWHYCRPPVAGLDYEMDCRRIPVERVLPA